MKKFENTAIGIKGFTLSTMVLGKQVKAIIDDVRENKSKISKIEGVDMPHREFACHSEDCWISHEGDKMNVYFEIEILQEIKDCETFIITSAISSTSPKELVMRNENDMSNIISAYNKFVASVSKSIPTFSECTISEVEYGINFDLNELGHKHITEELWELTQRGIPNSYDYFRCIYFNGYSNLEYRYKTSGDVTVQHYRDCCDVDTPVPTNVICFIVKIKTRDSIILVMREFAKDNSESDYTKNGNFLIMKQLFSEKKIKSVIKENFEDTIMRGSYFKMALAAEAVQNSSFNQKEKADMVAVLKYISESGNVHDAIAVRNQFDGLTFLKSLHNLSIVGVNPITIKDDCKVDHIPGLLETCESLVCDGIPVGKGERKKRGA